MFSQIKNQIDQHLHKFCRDIDNVYGLGKISPILSSSIKEFIVRDGKRVRPALMVIGYLGFAKKPAPGLYNSAISIELLHDFMLVHDDIIDKSLTRRGLPSMHSNFNALIKNTHGLKFSGQDMGIVAGDVLYSLALKAFMTIKVEPSLKEKALSRFIDAAFYTGCGEFIELINDTKSLPEVGLEDIYKVYDYKTAYYTFACPLACGAILAGASKKDVDALFEYGLALGRAFQINDDILGLYGNQKKIGKSPLTDLQESKKTLLIWHAYNHSGALDKKYILKVMTKKKVITGDLNRIRQIVKNSGSLDYARNEIEKLDKKAKHLVSSSQIKDKYKKTLIDLPKTILTA